MAKSEAELYRDKVELHLEGQQVFMLFFGGALLATLVFVLGVSIGRRIEKQEFSKIKTQLVSPLDALDKLELGDELTFSTVLRDESNKKIETKPTLQPLEDKEVVASKPEASKPEEQTEEKPEKSDEAKKVEAKSEKVEKDLNENSTPKVEDPPRRFTLQVGSFQDEKEARALEDSLKKEGYKAFTKIIKLGDKGTWYRVRFGNYQEYEKALEEKAEFEKAKNVIAYVTRIRK